MYHTIYFSDISAVASFYEYKQWLKDIQEKNKIEIASVTSVGVMLVVTYKKVAA